MTGSEFAKKVGWKKPPPYNRKIQYKEGGFSFCLKSKLGGIFRCSFSKNMIKFLIKEDISYDLEYDNVDEEYFSFTRIRYDVDRKNGVSHAHIQDHRPCLGGFFIPILDALKFGEIDNLIELCQRFLDTENKNDSYLYCSRCFELQDDCECC